jgi:iron complex outermembrane recepter protein
MKDKRAFRPAALATAAMILSLTGSLQALAAASNDELAEVTITAERRSENLQDVPISAVALSAQTLDERGIKTFEQLQYQVPSLTFTDNGNTKYVNIRGVGVSESAPNQTVGVAVHLDGAYVAREFVFGDAFFDLQDVEVLRGPQGTYSGQNASGGSIFINSKAPSFDRRDGFTNIELGNHKERRFGAGSSFKLSDTLAVRLAGEVETRDSFYDNHGPVLSTPSDNIENQPGNLNRSLVRAQLLFQPTDALQLRLIHEMSDVRTDGVPYKVFPVNGTNTLPTSGLRDLNYDLAGHRNVTYNRTTGKLEWAANDAFKLLANLSYLESHQHYLAEGDYGSPVTTPSLIQNGSDYLINDHYYTAEVNLVSTGPGPLEWTVGASRLDYTQNNYLNFLRYNNPPAYPGTGLDETLDTRLYLYLRDVRRNSAAFGEIGYQFTSQLEVKAGLRYNKDTVGFDPTSYIAAGPGSHYNATSGAPQGVIGLLDFSATTGRVLVNWKPTADNLIYGTVSKGYKPGGTTPASATYKSEFVTNYEVGWKGSLFDRKLTTSISAYSMKYDNFQRTFLPDPTLPPSASLTYNVNGSTIKGLEAQVSGKVADFSWDVSAAYNDGVYGDLALAIPRGAIDGVNPTVAGSFNLKGQPIDYLPKLTWNLGMSYRGWRTSGGRFVPSVRLSHQDEFYTTFYHYDYNLVPGKTLADVFLAYEADSDWRLELYATNVTDKDYISRANGGSSGSGQYLLGNPRQIGVKLSFRF